jgi:D-alanyl-lipoteichoic acid acyltransferase DltB (MBOAT superfamily)
MLFSTPTFGVFLALVVTLYWALGSGRPRARQGLLLVGSYYFYACWDVRFLALIFAVTVLDYVAGRVVERLGDDRRLRWLTVAVVTGLNLGLLGFWKYIAFFLTALSPLAELAGAPAPPHVEVVLPVGISFFTFQGLSYVIDVYRRDIRPERSFFRFALYIAFFPQLVAGPIVRAQELIPQLKRPRAVDATRFGSGLFLILGGLLKKVVLADYLAQNIVDRVFDLPSHYSSLETLCAIYGYALQIYGDFSGYSDIAIGSALLLGIELPENFNAPYRADGLRDFWRRWHISLSRWLRDYLYISLGGSRQGKWLTRRNLLITMVLGGLWHGASYTFLLWGALHGLGLVLERALFGDDRRRSDGTRWLRVLITFHVVAVLWVFFRADTFSGALAVLWQAARFVPGAANLSWQVLALIGAGFALHLAPRDLYQRVTDGFVRAPAVAQAAATIGVLHLVGAVASSGAAPFIYFQF